VDSRTIAFNGHTLASAFQPIHSARDKRTAGYEGLVRAFGPDGRETRPAVLFAGLDEAETVSLDRASRTLHLARFASIDPGAAMLFLNVHPVTALADAAQAVQVRNRVRYFGLPPTRVCLEILEGACGDEEALVDAVSAYRELGFTIAIDDFGVARSNFDRLARLGPDLVKIDRSFLAEAVGSVRARRMLPSVVALVHEAGARVVVEGIEAAGDALLAMEAGADYLQGHFLARPGPGLHDEAFTSRMLLELGRVQGSAARGHETVTAKLRRAG
jgi:EAL domain-containing protein (putative c-di-GMP-specific phosphodiesterase class I)